MNINYAEEAKKMMRISYKPEISFGEYAKQQGYSKEELSHEDDIAKVFFNYPYRTKRTAAMARSAAKRLAIEGILRKEYENLLASGVIKKIEIKTPLNPENESDRAYIRVQLKRKERKK